MAEYKTKALSLGDITVTASRASQDNAADRLEAVLEWIGDQIVDPGYGQGGSERPDQGLPGGKPVRPEQGLPGAQPGVDNSLPGGKPATPDQGLPGAQPEPDQGLPGGPPKRPDQGLPGEQPEVGNEVPGADLGKFLQEHAAEIAAAILKGTACDPAQPK